MPLAVAVVADGVRVPLSAARVRAVVQGVLRAERVTNALVSVAFVTSRAIGRLNRTHLAHAGPTDVIAFAFGPIGPRAPLVGDIYIAPQVARRNAHRHGVAVREEIARLLIHGALHLAGRDHPEGAGRERSPMWRRQEELLGRLGSVR